MTNSIPNKGSESETLMKNNTPDGGSSHESSAIAEKALCLESRRERPSLQQPILMICYAVAGIILALVHHTYYSYLHGRKIGSASRQQWATAFGTAFSFIVIALLKTAIGEAYNQYIWTLVRRRAYSLGCLDKLFALTSDPLGFFNWELLRHAKFGLVLALSVWYVAAVVRCEGDPTESTIQVHSHRRTNSSGYSRSSLWTF
jgi:hypothetical protein